jgi:acyl carrier protein
MKSHRTPMPESIQTAVVEFIAENLQYRAEREALSESVSLLKAGVLDSMGVLELVDFLESTFSIVISDEEVVPANLDTIGGIASFVARKRAVDQGEIIAHAS